ncbi:hypothetical protein SPAN111604_10465 [Sphingomonas antarctica]|uniref:hypothetical protein n=1 Tax=Sphingomonas antarctica TaxID=2040274 RepID=UPI0039EB58C7
MNRDVSEPYIETNPQQEGSTAGGRRPEDSSNKDDYDEAQRAEIAEVEGGGRSDGTILTDMDADMGEDIDSGDIEDDGDNLTTIIDTNI